MAWITYRSGSRLVRGNGFLALSDVKSDLCDSAPRCRITHIYAYILTIRATAETLRSRIVIRSLNLYNDSVTPREKLRWCHAKLYKSNSHKASLTWNKRKEKWVLSGVSSLFTPQTAGKLVESSVVVYTGSLWADWQDRPAHHLSFFFFLNAQLCTFVLFFFFPSGRHAAAYTDAAPKCCHTGAGPPNRYKITAWSYQCHVSQRKGK